MTILASLARAYERLPDAPPFGYAFRPIHGCIVINAKGEVAGPIVRWDKDAVGKSSSRALSVPYLGGRSGTKPPPYFLWDNTAYVLGVTKKPKADALARHAAFKEYAEHLLASARGIQLGAMLEFLRNWDPNKVSQLEIDESFLDKNLVFRLDTEKYFVHEAPEVTAIWEAEATKRPAKTAVCLVSGRGQRIADLHSPIWGFADEARIVSYNASAYESYGHSNGDNAPVSEQAAFAYTTALNIFLAKGSKNRIQIGDTSTVFWADASDAETAETAEDVWLSAFSEIDETQESARVRSVLEGLRNGRPLADLDPGLTQGVRFYVLGLAPNAARISIRFWYDSDFADLARNFQRFVKDMHIEPPPRNGNPPFWQYLAETAVQKKRENVPPNLAGEWMRAILTGNRYPLTLLTNVLMRIRADGEVNALRVSMLKAVLARNFERKDIPVALDPDFKDKGYLLGRLFAVYERIQESALGRNVNATIKDKFYGSASAQPRKVFSVIDRNSANHLAKVAKQAPGFKVFLERTLSDIMGKLNPADDPYPASLSAQEQALFGLGYYHQRSSFFQTRDNDATETAQ